MPDPLIVRFAVWGHFVAVRTADPALARAIGGLFPEYRVVEAADEPQPVLFDVGSDGDGFVLTSSEGPSYRCATLTELLSRTEFVLTTEFLDHCEEFVPLHAAGAVVRGRAALALGRAGAGKSSLAIAWHRAGHAALGDDAVLVAEDGRVHPFKRLYEVEAAVLRKLGIDPASTSFWEAGSDEAWYDPSLGAGWADPAPVAVVAVVRYSPGASLDIRSLSRAEALNALTHSRLEPVQDPGGGLERLARIAERAAAYEVTFGSALEAAARLAVMV